MKEVEQAAEETDQAEDIIIFQIQEFAVMIDILVILLRNLLVMIAGGDDDDEQFLMVDFHSLLHSCPIR